jgi:monoamine oxidase
VLPRQRSGGVMTNVDPTIPPMRRREFLTRVGLVGGAGALYSSMDALGLVASPANAPAAWAAEKAAWRPPARSDFTLTGRGGKDVVILGAGMAGLVTAYELGKAGYRCTILEARQRPGGRNWTVRGGDQEAEIDGPLQRSSFSSGQYMNAGPARIAGHMVTLEYCRELGVPIEVFTNANADGYYFNEPSSTVGGALAGTPVRHRKAKADAFGYVTELLAKAVNQGALDAELTAADKDALISFLRSFGALTDANRYTGGSRTGYAAGDEPAAGFQGGTPLPAAARSDVLASRLGNYFSFELSWDQAMLMYQPVGGMDRIPYAFEAALRRKPTYGAAITDISTTTEGVTVTYDHKGRTRTATGHLCICTIPPQILKNIPNNFGPQVNADLAVPTINATGKIGLQYRRRWWEEDEQLFGGITNTNMDLGTIWYPSYGYLGQKGVLIGYYNFGGSSDAYGALSPAEREARALAQGAKIHGQVYVDEFETSFSNDWRKTRYSEGGWIGWPGGTRGGPDTPYGRLLQPAGNVYFAGDHLSHVIAWQHGALESARLTVTNLHARVLAA